MFGIDIGITTSSVTCITGKTKGYKIVDFSVLFGDTKQKDDWKRVVDMSDAIVEAIYNICRSHPGMSIKQLVSIEEPVFAYRVRNYKSFMNMCFLYALLRNKLFVRGFKVYSVNPATVKSVARKLVFEGKKLKSTFIDRTGKLTKAGMVKAFKKFHGREPFYSNKVGRETLADSYFIAMAGLEKRAMQINVKQI